MERASSESSRASLGTLVTALAVVFSVAAIWAAAALADGSSDPGSSVGDGARADLIQDDGAGTPFDDEEGFRGGGGFFDDEDCPLGERGFGDGPDDGPDAEPESDPNDSAADL